MKDNLTNEVDAMFSGSKVALSKLLTLVERQQNVIPEVMGLISSRLGKAHCIGITGAAGAGKSSLINQLVTVIRQKNLSIGVLVVDPSSVLTGGALLGDRIRMQQHNLDEKVFIRSLATRGSMGGLTKNIPASVNILDAFGEDIILIETIGAGQNDVSVRYVADTVIAVFTPESGDVIQFMKGGIVEIADIIVVNKYDAIESENTAGELKEILAMRQNAKDWDPPVLIASALDGTGVDLLYSQIELHRQYLDSVHWPNREVRINNNLNPSPDN